MYDCGDVHHGKNGNNIRWFETYLTNCKQFLTFNNKNTNFAKITCGVPQGSILGPFFLIYVNDLCNASNNFDPIMFTDDTNYFFSHRNILTLFLTVNNELHKIGELFKANRLSLNIKKDQIYIFSQEFS